MSRGKPPWPVALILTGIGVCTVWEGAGMLVRAAFASGTGSDWGGGALPLRADAEAPVSGAAIRSKRYEQSGDTGDLIPGARDL